MKLHTLAVGTRFQLTGIPTIKGRVIGHSVGSSMIDFGGRPKAPKETDDADEGTIEINDRTLYGRINISRNTEVTPLP